MLAERAERVRRSSSRRAKRGERWGKGGETRMILRDGFGGMIGDV